MAAEVKGKSAPFTFTVHRGSDLPAGDSDNKSDPYVKFFFGPPENEGVKGWSGRTTRKNGTVDPVWNESFTFDFHKSPKTVNLVVKDYDRLRDDFLGCAEVDLSAIRANDTLAVPLVDKDGNVVRNAYSEGRSLLYLSWEWAVEDARAETVRSNRKRIGATVGSRRGSGSTRGSGGGVVVDTSDEKNATVRKTAPGRSQKQQQQQWPQRSSRRPHQSLQGMHPSVRRYMMTRSMEGKSSGDGRGQKAGDYLRRMKVYKKLFTKADKDKDHCLSYRELKEALKKFLSLDTTHVTRPIRTVDLLAFMNRYDDDDDGVIRWAEFVEILQTLERGEGPLDSLGQDEAKRELEVLNHFRKLVRAQMDAVVSKQLSDGRSTQQVAVGVSARDVRDFLVEKRGYQKDSASFVADAVVGAARDSHKQLNRYKRRSRFKGGDDSGDSHSEPEDGESKNDGGERNNNRKKVVTEYDASVYEAFPAESGTDAEDTDGMETRRASMQDVCKQLLRTLREHHLSESRARQHSKLLTVFAKLFRRHDKDGNGRINVSEMTMILTSPEYPITCFLGGVPVTTVEQAEELAAEIIAKVRPVNRKPPKGAKVGSGDLSNMYLEWRDIRRWLHAMANSSTRVQVRQSALQSGGEGTVTEDEKATGDGKTKYVKHFRLEDTAPVVVSDDEGEQGFHERRRNVQRSLKHLKKARRLWKAADTDGDNALAASEVRKFVEGSGLYPEDKQEAIMDAALQQLGKTGQSKLRWADFLQVMDDVHAVGDEVEETGGAKSSQPSENDSVTLAPGVVLPKRLLFPGQGTDEKDGGRVSHQEQRRERRHIQHYRKLVKKMQRAREIRIQHDRREQAEKQKREITEDELVVEDAKTATDFCLADVAEYFFRFRHSTSEAAAFNAEHVFMRVLARDAVTFKNDQTLPLDRLLWALRAEDEELRRTRAVKRMQKVVALFQKIDADHDRKITRKEFVDYLLHHPEEFRSKEDINSAAARFAEMDTDGSGNVTWSQFDAYLKKHHDLTLLRE